MKSLALALALFATASTALAEPAVYLRSDGQFVANGNEYPRGFWVPAVQGADEVFTSSEALNEYRLHIEDAKWFSGLTWGAVGAVLAFTLLASHPDGGVALAVFALPFAGGAYAGMKSNQHLFKAINLQNGIPPTQAELSPMRRAREKALQYTLASWSF
jgi:hypothetical protein